MQKILFTEKNVDWVQGENIVETYLADILPNVKDCPSSYAIVFKDGALLQTELREGERPTRRLDIPGGHIDEGETPEECAVRETFEETGVHVKVIKLAGYKKVMGLGPRPEGWRYPYPTGYMAFYLCEVVEETPFDGNEDTHGRVWLPQSEFEKSEWCKQNIDLLKEIILF
jgi:8-oxo-dGTP diphosphatase